jgi:hypothetical protein
MMTCLWCGSGIRQDLDGWWLLSGEEDDSDCDAYECAVSPRHSHEPSSDVSGRQQRSILHD